MAAQMVLKTMISLYIQQVLGCVCTVMCACVHKHTRIVKDSFSHCRHFRDWAGNGSKVGQG